LGVEPQSIGTDRNKRKKKNGINKQKRNGPLSTSDDQYENDDNTSKSIDQLDPQQKLQRLHELENKFIGGEELNNEERKKKRKKKLNEMREKQEQRKRFTQAIGTNDDDMMIRVFDNVQEEVSSIRFLFKLLQSLRYSIVRYFHFFNARKYYFSYV
jgi:hypothetical protein